MYLAIGLFLSLLALSVCANPYQLPEGTKEFPARQVQTPYGIAVYRQPKLSAAKLQVRAEVRSFAAVASLETSDGDVFYITPADRENLRAEGQAPNWIFVLPSCALEQSSGRSTTSVQESSLSLPFESVARLEKALLVIQQEVAKISQTTSGYDPAYAYLVDPASYRLHVVNWKNRKVEQTLRVGIGEKRLGDGPGQTPPGFFLMGGVRYAKDGNASIQTGDTKRGVTGIYAELVYPPHYKTESLRGRVPNGGVVLHSYNPEASAYLKERFLQKRIGRIPCTQGCPVVEPEDAPKLIPYLERSAGKFDPGTKANTTLRSHVRSGTVVERERGLGDPIYILSYADPTPTLDAARASEPLSEQAQQMFDLLEELQSIEGPFLDPLAFARDEFLDIERVNPTIIVDLPYATEDNFTKTKLYEHNRCFLRAEVARRLDAAASDLAKIGLRLKIWDGYRPLAIQQKLWQANPNQNYVGDPAKGSRHNRGAAVDVTLTTPEGDELRMPTGYDVFAPKAHAGAEPRGRDDQEALANRKLLQHAMVKNGFQIMQTEWWHFDAVGYDEFEVADIPLDVLVRKADSRGLPTATARDANP